MNFVHWTLIAIGIIVIIIFIWCSYKKFTSNEGFSGESTGESIANVASLYNTGKFTVSNMNITSNANINSLDVSGRSTLSSINSKGNLNNTGNFTNNGNAVINGSLVVNGTDILNEIANIKYNYVKNGSPIGIRSGRGGYLQDAGGWVQGLPNSTSDWDLMYIDKVRILNGKPVS